MTRELATTAPDDEDVHALGLFGSAGEAFGALYAAVAGLAIGGFEALSDRRAEANAGRLRRRASAAASRRLRAKAKRGSLA